MALNPVSKRESPTLPIYKEKNAEIKRDVFFDTRNKKRGQCSQLSIVPVFIDQRADGPPKLARLREKERVHQDKSP